MLWVILFHEVRSWTVLHTFFTRQTSSTLLLHLQIFCFELYQGVADRQRSQEGYQGFLSPAPFLSFSQTLPIPVLFKIRFTELAQDSNQLAEHSMKTIPKGLRGPTLHPGKCQKTSEQWPRAAAVDFCHLNISLSMKRIWKRSNYNRDLAYGSNVMES